MKSRQKVYYPLPEIAKRELKMVMLWQTSRCIEIPMERATRLIRKKIDKEGAVKLRMKLLDYRLKNLFEPLPELDLPFENGRNHELFTPLIQIAPDSFRQIIINYGIKLEKNRVIEEVTSFEGDVLQSVLEVIRKSKLDKFKTNDVFEEYKGICDTDLDTLSKRQASIKNRIGRVLKNKFHFEKGHHKEYFVDKMKLYRTMKRFTPSLISKYKEYLGDDFDPTLKIGAIGAIGAFRYEWKPR